jgi:DNA-binding MarR family transcriptional regulator
MNREEMPVACACEVLDVVPLVMHGIRSELRRQRSPELSMTQFRTLLHLQRHPGSSLAAVADFIGLALPSMSKLVEGLVCRGLAAREDHAADRRRVTLCLTPAGAAAARSATALAEDHLARRLAALTAEETALIAQAMQLLRGRFSTPGEPPSN